MLCLSIDIFWNVWNYKEKLWKNMYVVNRHVLSGTGTWGLACPENEFRPTPRNTLQCQLQARVMICLCFFPNSSHNEKGTVKSQAVKVPWDFSPWAADFPILLWGGPWVTSLHHGFNGVFRWLTNLPVCSNFFWFIRYNTPCQRDPKLDLCLTRMNCLACCSS